MAIRKNKFGAVKKVYNNTEYHSTKEAKRAMVLDIMLKNNLISNLQKQVRYTWEVVHRNIETGAEFIKKQSYISDFEYTDSIGNHIVEDAKGFRTPEYKRKKKIMKKIFGIDILET